VKNTFKVLLVSAGLAFATQATAQFGSTVTFNRDGTAATQITFTTLDWAPDNALAIGSLGQAGGTAPPGTITTVAQGFLDQFLGATNNGVLAGTEYTFQASITETQVGVGTGTASFIPTGGTFVVCYDPTADHNQLAGTGYGNNSGGCDGDAIAILTGTIVSGQGSFTDNTRALGLPTQPIDQFVGAGNNYPGVTTDQGSGSTTIFVNVTSQNSAFFVTNISSLAIDLSTSTNLTVPFTLADPSALVVGIAPQFSGGNVSGVNGADCPRTGGAGTPFVARCDFLFQTDPATSFAVAKVPEPGTLALLGLGSLVLGWRQRRVMRKS